MTQSLIDLAIFALAVIGVSTVIAAVLLIVIITIERN